MNIPRLTQYREMLFRYLKPQRTRVIILAVLLFSSIGLQLANPQILRYFIDTAIQSGTQPPLYATLNYPYNVDMTQIDLLLAAIIFIVVALGHLGFQPQPIRPGIETGVCAILTGGVEV